jgi:hypothetical protein
LPGTDGAWSLDAHRSWSPSVRIIESISSIGAALGLIDQHHGDSVSNGIPAPAIGADKMKSFNVFSQFAAACRANKNFGQLGIYQTHLFFSSRIDSI